MDNRKFPVYTKVPGQFFRTDEDRSNISVRIDRIAAIGCVERMEADQFDTIIGMEASSETEFINAYKDATIRMFLFRQAHPELKMLLPDAIEI